jgi:hypothetical protein
MSKTVVSKCTIREIARLICVGILLSVQSLPALAERPVALVESISNAPEAEVSAFDYVYRKDKIDLRPGGAVTLSYFDSCVVETVRGGVVKLKEDSAKVTKGGQSQKSQRPCQSGGVIVTAAMAEAGAAIKRLSPFESGRWREWTVRDRPTFKWNTPRRADGPTTLRVVFADADPTRAHWEGQTSAAFLDYPADAPAFEIGRPYVVTAFFSNGDEVDGVFSVDPALEVPDTPISRLVHLGWEEDDD